MFRIDYFWHCDAIYDHIDLGPTLVQVMAGGLAAPSLQLTYNQWDVLAIGGGQFHRNCSRYHSIQNVWKLHIWKYGHISQGPMTWWRHQMKTFSALLTICVGNSPVSGEFPAQRPVTRSFKVLFDLRLNKRLSKQSWGWWFETLPCPLWRHCNELITWILQSRARNTWSPISQGEEKNAIP